MLNASAIELCLFGICRGFDARYLVLPSQCKCMVILVRKLIGMREADEVAHDLPRRFGFVTQRAVIVYAGHGGR